MVKSKSSIWYKKYEIEIQQRIKLQDKLNKVEECYKILEEEAGKKIEGLQEEISVLYEQDLSPEDPEEGLKPLKFDTSEPRDLETSSRLNRKRPTGLDISSVMDFGN